MIYLSTYRLADILIELNFKKITSKPATYTHIKNFEDKFLIHLAKY